MFLRFLCTTVVSRIPEWKTHQQDLTLLALDLIQLRQFLEVPQSDLATKSSSCCSSTIVFVDCNVMGSQWMSTDELIYQRMLLRTSMPKLDTGIASDRDNVGGG